MAHALGLHLFPPHLGGHHAAMDCSLLGLILPPGEKTVLKAQFDEDVIETLHITQVALGPKPKPGPHVVMVEKGGQKFAIGTLDAARCTQFSCDFALAMDEVELSHTGGSEVHLTGYRVEQMMGGSEDEDGYGLGSDESEEDSEPEEESSEDEEAPDAVPLKGTAPKPVKPRARSLVDDEAEETSEEEEEDDMEDDEDDDESEEEAAADKGAFGGRLVRIVGDDEESSEEEEESSGEEEEEEEEEESEEEPSPAPAAAKKQQQQAKQQVQQPAAKQQQQQGSKRPADALAAAKTPQPAKKAKAEQLKAPATAPAKVAPAAQAAPTNEKEYVAALKDALKAGPLKLAQLGTKVKRPPGVHKVKHVIDTNQNVFKYNKETDQVSLK